MILVGVGETRPSDVISLFLGWSGGVHHGDANGLRARLQMAYGLPFLKKNEPSDAIGLCVWLQTDYVRGSKWLMVSFFG